MGKRPLAALASLTLVVGWVLHDSMRTDLPKIEPAVSDDAGPVKEPVSPIRGLGGRPIGEPPPAAPLYTNESLQKHLEEQKKAMGIKRIIVPSESEESPSSGHPIAERMSLRESPQVHIQGSTPRIDSSRDTRSQDGPLSVVSPYPGTIVSKADDVETAWAEANLSQPRPSVDFSKEALVIAPGPILNIHERAGYLVVDYRDKGPQAARYAIISKTTLPVVFERLP